MAKICGIYKITSSSGKIYIGQSVNIKSRLSRYRNHACPGQPKLLNSLKKYGFNNHKFEIIVKGEFNNYLLDELEKHYIQLYNSFNNGLNCTTGGKGGAGCIQSAENRLKKSISCKGLKRSEETKRRISIAQKTKIVSDITRKRIGDSKRGLKASAETKLKMSMSRKGKSINGKKVQCTITGKIWNSIKECWYSEYKEQYCLDHFKRMLTGKKRNMTSIVYYKE